MQDSTLGVFPQQHIGVVSPNTKTFVDKEIHNSGYTVS